MNIIPRVSSLKSDAEMQCRNKGVAKATDPWGREILQKKGTHKTAKIH